MGRRAQQGGILHGNQIESTRWEWRFQETGVQPFHLDVDPICCRSSAAQGNLRDIDRRDLPPEAGQPDCICPFTATDVECGTRFKAAHN